MNVYRVRLRFQCPAYSIIFCERIRAKHGVEAVQAGLRKSGQVSLPADAQLVFMSAFLAGEVD